MREEDLREEYDFGLKPCCESAIENHKSVQGIELDRVNARVKKAKQLLVDAVDDVENGIDVNKLRGAINDAIVALED